MISRTYTVDKGDGSELLCYKGFNQQYMDAPYVATLFCGGEWEFWALDNLAAAKEDFEKFLQDDEGELYRSTIVAYYRNETGDHSPVFDIA